MGDVNRLMVTEFAGVPALWAGAELRRVGAVGFDVLGKPGHRMAIVDAFCQRPCCQIGLRSPATRLAEAPYRRPETAKLGTFSFGTSLACLGVVGALTR